MRTFPSNAMRHKRCFKCSSDLRLSEFYRHPAMADGYLNKCKSCARADVRKHRRKNLEKVRQYDRNRPNKAARIEQMKSYAKTPRGAEVVRKAKRAWRQKNRHKIRAERLARRAILSGKIHKLPCSVCGTNARVEAHHEDYSKPLAVVFLCDKHHKRRHAEIREMGRKSTKVGAP